MRTNKLIAIGTYDCHYYCDLIVQLGLYNKKTELERYVMDNGLVTLVWIILRAV